MTRWVALLRGVNVGGHRRVPMAALRTALEAAGMRDVRTYLQSGNAVLDADGDEASVQAAVQRVVADAIGVDCDVMVRSADDLRDVVRRNPWPERVDAPTLLHVVFLAGPAGPDAAASRVGPQEEVVVDGREVWVWYGDGAGRSRLSLDGIGVAATARNWRTVSALVDLAGG